MEALLRLGEDEARTVTGRLVSIAERPVRFAEWMFGVKAPGIDLVLMLFAAGWAMLELLRPRVFDIGAFVGLRWVADPIWLGLHVLLTLLHGIGLMRPCWQVLRIAAAFLSAWHWLFVAFSLVRIDITPSVVAYTILGLWALLGGIYLAGLPRKAA